MVAQSTTSQVAGHFGRLWGRGHEVLEPHFRRILSITGKGATSYLQNLVTADLQNPPTPPRPEPANDPKPGVPRKLQPKPGDDMPLVEFSHQLRAACFLDNKGRILTDSLLWKMSDEQYYIDVPGSAADTLLQHLHQYKLRRSKVEITDRTEDMASAVIYGTLNAQGTPPGYVAGLDPRHPSLGIRVLKLPPESTDSGRPSPSLQNFSNVLSKTFPSMPGNYELVRRLAGVAEGSELEGRVALECNQEHLNAVSFHKGCYLGQELTARVHHTGVLRKRIMPMLLLDPYTEVPQAWRLAANLQTGREKSKFTSAELKQLPSRLPRLSVVTAGNLVAITTGAILEQHSPEDAVDQEAKMELQRALEKGQQLVEAVQRDCVMGAKLIDLKNDKDKTVGQIVSPPVHGTNIVLALMRLEAVGLLEGGTWSHTNKVRVGDSEFRFLPYLPLWWPELDPTTGKAKEPQEDDEEQEEVVDEDRQDKETSSSSKTGWKLPRITIEQLPLHEDSSTKAN